MEQSKKTSQKIVPDVEKLIQEIQDDAYSIRLFNEEIGKEIDNCTVEEEIIVDFIRKNRK